MPHSLYLLMRHDAAVAGAVASKYRNAGQTCICANRILVQDEIYDEFAAKLTRQAKAFVLGDGSDEQVTMGPLIHQGAAESCRFGK